MDDEFMVLWAEFINIWELYMNVEGIWRDMWTQDKHFYLEGNVLYQYEGHL